ncbi:MAG: hypothetical protein QOG06_450, partial [Gaiellaceae bacterium]|nr:hypothetical protein [Gaiellaceae bacterium]
VPAYTIKDVLDAIRNSNGRPLVL